MGRIADWISHKAQDFIIGTVEAAYGHKIQAELFGPAGDVSIPIKDDKVVLIPIGDNEICLGVLCVDKSIDKGEKYLFSRDPDSGDVKASIWLKKDGKLLIDCSSDIEIKSDTKIKLMNGNKHLVQFEELKIQVDQLKQDLANQTHTFSVTLAPSGTYNGTTATGLPAPSSDFSNCKIDNIEVP